MPSQKQFESFKLTIPFSIEYLDMFEMSEIFFELVRTTLKYIDDNKVACFETGIDGAYYKIKRVDKTIIIKKLFEGESTEIKIEGMSFMNWLFGIIPFVGMVGESKGNF